MSQSRVSVVKIGGSLLTSPEFPRRLRAWLEGKLTDDPNTHFVLVVGGGKWVDAIRELDAHVPLGEERAHWLCVEIMDVTAGLVAAMLPGLCLASTFSELELRVVEPGVTLLAPSEFVERVEPTLPGTRLRADWSVTSDSIAARLAIALGADEVVLLKSAAPPLERRDGSWLAELAVAGYVDGFLPRLEAELPPFEFRELRGG